MGLAPEINTYINKHPEDADNFISLYNETYDAVKQVSPNTSVLVTFQFESLSGTNGDIPRWEIINQFEPKLDLVGITTYPGFWFETPFAISPTYYSQITNYTSKPIIIAESGWPSGGEASFHGSVINQKDFLNQVVTLTKDIDVRLWIWWFLHDYAGEGVSEYFKTMGLRISSGEEKESWVTWQTIYNQMKSDR
jgi:hypothetical protein